MYYIKLHFENAGLITHKHKGEKMKHYINCGGHYSIDKENKGDDFYNPIPAHCLSNALHSICGLVPIPFDKRKRTKSFDKVFTRNESLYNIAANNSFVHYDNELNVNENGIPNVREFFMTAKPAWKSNVQSQSTFTDYVGNKFERVGVCTMSYVRSGLENDTREKFLNLLSEFIGMECRSMTMDDIMIECSRQWDLNPERCEYFKEKAKELNIITWYMNMFFTKKTNSTSNIGLGSGKTLNRIKNPHGTGLITKISGDIICEIPESELETLGLIMSHKNAIASFLEGGMIYVTEIKKYEPVAGYKEEWLRIFEQKSSETDCESAS